VFELKRIVEGILKRPPDEQRLYKVRQAGASVVRVGTRWEVRRGCHIASGGGSRGIESPPDCRALLAPESLPSGKLRLSAVVSARQRSWQGRHWKPAAPARGPADPAARGWMGCDPTRLKQR
jgi:hypothetical protein